MKQLPATSQWSNVNLINATRAITNQNGENTTGAGNLPTTFSYAGYAARLLTYQEISNGCCDGTTTIYGFKGLSSKCKYLMENTRYSSDSSTTDVEWLESPLSSHTYNAWHVNASTRAVNSQQVDYAYNTGVRPAIEVLKSNISY